MSLAPLPGLPGRIARLLAAGSAATARAAREEEDMALVDLLVSWRLAGEAAASLPPAHGLHPRAVRALALERERIALAARRRAATLELVAEALAGAGLRALLLKGEAIIRLTHGDPSRRPMSDIDLLAPARDFDRVVGVLVAAGLERSRHDDAMQVVLLHALPGDRHPLAIEVHRDLLEPPHPFELHVEAVMARATPTGRGGLALAEPSDALAWTAAHLVFHEHDASKGLLALRDVALLLGAGASVETAARRHPDLAAIVEEVARRARAWAGAATAGAEAPGRLGPCRRLALTLALGELDAGLRDPQRARWRVLGRRLGQALWWPRAGEKARALWRLARGHARPAALARAARALAAGARR